MQPVASVTIVGPRVAFIINLSTVAGAQPAHALCPDKNKSGFLPEERMWISRVIKTGYVDAFRHFYPYSSGQYTWWSYRKNSRKHNMGWRFDYFFVDEKTINRVTDVSILPEITCSDHCPIGIQIEFWGHNT